MIQIAIKPDQHDADTDFAGCTWPRQYRLFTERLLHQPENVVRMDQREWLERFFTLLLGEKK